MSSDPEDTNSGLPRKEGDGNMVEEEEEEDAVTGLTGYAMNEVTNPCSKLLYDFGSYEFMSQRETIISALTAAVAGDRLVSADKSGDSAWTYSDFLACDDTEFNDLFRITRNTMRAVVADLNRCGYEPTGTDLGVQDAFLLLLWYLGAEGRSLSVASKVFDLLKKDKNKKNNRKSVVKYGRPRKKKKEDEDEEDRGIDIARRALVDVATAVATHLLEPAGVVWPDQDELADIERNFDRRHKFPSLAGLLGFLVFVPKAEEKAGQIQTNPPPPPPPHPEVGERSDAVALQGAADADKMTGGRPVVAFQAVVDDRESFRDLHAVVRPCQPLATPCSVLVNSPLFERLKQPNMGRFHLLAGGAYPQWGCLLTPYVDDGKLSKEDVVYNRSHHSAMNTLREAFSRLLTRFPKLGHLELTASDSQQVILAAAVVYNYCLLWRDLAPVT